jgi:hypothetical protein
MIFEELLKEKENLMIRFLKLTEEALTKIEKEEEEALPGIMEKRDILIQQMQDLEIQLVNNKFLSRDQGIRIKELKARMLTENKFLQEKMQENFKNIKENIGNNKKEIKVNKAYSYQSGESLYLNKKN